MNHVTSPHYYPASGIPPVNPAEHLERIGNCWYCGFPIIDCRDGVGMWEHDGASFMRPIPEGYRRRATDHQTPRSRGGTNRYDNLVDACGSCNSRKGTHTVEEYREYLAIKTGTPVVFFGETPLAREELTMKSTTELTPTQQKAFDTIINLRTLTRDTGTITTRAQNDVLRALNSIDIAAVANRLAER